MLAATNRARRKGGGRLRRIVFHPRRLGLVDQTCPAGSSGAGRRPASRILQAQAGTVIRHPTVARGVWPPGGEIPVSASIPQRRDRISRLSRLHRRHRMPCRSEMVRRQPPPPSVAASTGSPLDHAIGGNIGVACPRSPAGWTDAALTSPRRRRWRGQGDGWRSCPIPSPSTDARAWLSSRESSLRAWAQVLGRHLRLLPYQPESWSAAKWDQFYASGQLRYFSGLDELGRYSTLSRVT